MLVSADFSSLKRTASRCPSTMMISTVHLLKKTRSLATISSIWSCVKRGRTGFARDTKGNPFHLAVKGSRRISVLVEPVVRRIPGPRVRKVVTFDLAPEEQRVMRDLDSFLESEV